MAASLTVPVTIDHCGRTMAANVVAFAIRWNGLLPEDRDVTWAVRVTRDDGGSQVELGHRRASGQSLQYVRDLATGRTQEVRPDADLDSAEITVRFPADVVGLAVEWPTWLAVLVVDGEDVASLAVTL